MKRYRIVHISDFHFSHVSLNPFKLFSKRWIGVLNLLFSRKKIFQPSQLEGLDRLFEEKGIDLVLATGDFSTTSLPLEFQDAKNFFRKLGMPSFFLPGNHDFYTKKDYRKKTFYRFFENPPSKSHIASSYTLKKDRMEARAIFEDWWTVSLDTAVPTRFYSSQGLFSEEIEEKLQGMLQLLPKDAKIILANHFPFFLNDSPRRHLLRGPRLQTLIQKWPNIHLYLHGHTHRHCIADLRASKLPVILDSGSCSHKDRGTFNVIELKKDVVSIEVYTKKERWTSNRKIEFTL